MPFDVLNKGKLSALKEAADTLANLGVEKAQEVLADINLLLEQLQSAGYGVSSLSFELNLPPKVTIKLKTGPAVKEEKLNTILHDYAEKKVVTTIVGSLIQANRLRSSVTVKMLQLEEVEIALTTAPNITLQWKDKDSQKQHAVVAA